MRSDTDKPAFLSALVCSSEFEIREHSPHVSLRLAHGRHQFDRDPPVADRRDARADGHLNTMMIAGLVIAMGEVVVTRSSTSSTLSDGSGGTMILTSTGATVVVRIFGPDMGELRAKAQEIAKVMEGVDGVANLKVEQQLLKASLEILPVGKIRGKAGWLSACDGGSRLS